MGVGPEGVLPERKQERVEKGAGDSRGARKVRLKEVNRKQLLLRPVDIEALVAEDHPVRAIWEFVGKMDLERFYQDIEVVEGEAGRSALDPKLLISLWIYAYSDGVSSAREIERLCEYHPGYQWLTGMEKISHHTLSDFRVKHQEGLDALFVQALGILSAEGLITLERVMHDGTKVKANAGADTFRREEKIRLNLQMAQEQVKQMGDPRSEEVSRRVAKAQERVVRERKQRLQTALAELQKIQASKVGEKAKAEARVSETDPEARIMKQSDGGYAPSYNVQLSTDAAEDMIVAVGVSQHASDYPELVPAVERVEANVGKPDQVVADGGFTSRENIIEMNNREIDFYGSMGKEGGPQGGSCDRRGVDPAFRPEAFCYDSLEDTYRCPAGQTLTYESKEERSGQTYYYRYRALAVHCRACVWKEKCCPENESKGRSILRVVEDPVVVAFREKMQGESAKAIYKQRGRFAEFPHAWIKEKVGLRQFRLRGLTKVRIEAVWACLTYNIQQWIRLRFLPQVEKSYG